MWKSLRARVSVCEDLSLEWDFRFDECDSVYWIFDSGIIKEKRGSVCCFCILWAQFYSAQIEWEMMELEYWCLRKWFKRFRSVFVLKIVWIL